MDLGLAGKVAVITGASMGIGYACAETFLREGAQVAICARDGKRLDQSVEALRNDPGGAVIGVRADMGVRDDASGLMRTAFETFGAIHVLVNCAGSSPGGLLEDLTEEQWFGSLNLKFMGYVRAITEAIPYLRRNGGWGRIVNVVGNDGVKPSYWELTAGAANAADLNVTLSLAEQYGREGITVNAVNPGPVSTGRWDTLEKAFARDKGIPQDEAHELAVKSIPLGRICTPQEVAGVVVFLASERASFVNGGLLTIDGAQRKGIMDT
ncbi:MAG TPA: SDR family oxidoreductase [Chloroflexota bacterium]|nr:SDR family oxidoreductase [Chloroflexota bacterium]